MRNTIALVGLLLCLLSAALPQERDSSPEEQARFKQNLEEKLSLEFVKSGGWLLDYDEARARAAKEKKVLFVYFTRTFAP